MDDKTLEYMGERVDRARDLIRKIKNIDEKLALIEEASGLKGIWFRPKDWTSNSIELDQWAMKQLVTDVEPAIINTLTNIRDALQNELDQI